MFDVTDIQVLEQVETGVFWDNHIVCFTLFTENKTFYYNMRTASKQTVVDHDEMNACKEEWDTRLKLKCPFIVKFLTSFQDMDYIYYVTELCKGGYFYQYLRDAKYFSKDIVRFYFAEIVLGIQYLHRKGYMYRLLAPNNIMLCEKGHIKLKYDFLNALGLSEEDYLSKIEYIPIDYIRTEKIDYVSDYWSMGIILYEMLVGRTPFHGRSHRETIQNILNAKLVFPDHVDNVSRDLISKLLERDPAKRLGAKPNDKYVLREHKFFEGMYWNNIYERTIPAPIRVPPFKWYGIKEGRTIRDVFPYRLKSRIVDGFGKTFRYYGTSNDSIEYLW
ncbi:cAMP-dependent protein kinase, catalytic subunit-like [Astathelohania contejeani]|uniref:cAMP-dependent protein kinase n=1 Tax=Astathelohania contejeani TaxID=164912 RepID=A0ABQ7I1N4_9MICR|nr:cAMP-dependent protein kinase, catalytic subunit-like [Thelohania contejeani]